MKTPPFFASLMLILDILIDRLNLSMPDRRALMCAEKVIKGDGSSPCGPVSCKPYRNGIIFSYTNAPDAKKDSAQHLVAAPQPVWVVLDPLASKKRKKYKRPGTAPRNVRKKLRYSTD